MKHRFFNSMFTILIVLISQQAYSYDCSSMTNVIVATTYPAIVPGNVMSTSAPDNAARLRAALIYADAHGKGLCIPNGTYYFKTTASYTTGDLIDITLEPRAILKATNQLNYIMLNFRGIRNEFTGFHRGTVNIKGGNLDVSSVPRGVRQNAGTAVQISWARNINITGVNFFAGNGTTYSQRNADTGLGIVNSNISYIQNNQFYGFDDAGVYLGGDNAPYDPLAMNKYQSRIHVRNNRFNNNGLGVAIKRRFPYVEIRNNRFKYSDTDILEGETSDNHPGSRLYVIGNKGENFTQRFVLLTHSRGSIIRDNILLIRPNHQSDPALYHPSNPHFYSKTGFAIITVRGGANNYNYNYNGDWIHGNKIYDWRHRGAQSLAFVGGYPFRSCIDRDFTATADYEYHYEAFAIDNIRLTSNRIMTGNTGVTDLSYPKRLVIRDQTCVNIIQP